MDPVKQPASPPPQENLPNLDATQAASVEQPYHGRKTSVWTSCRALLNKLINWLSKPVKTRKIKAHIAQSSHFSNTEFNKNCTEILMAIIEKRNRKLPELLNKLRLSIPAAIPHKNEKEIESSDIIALFENWSAQCNNPAIAESLRKDLLNPGSNIRKIWTSQQALMAEARDFSHQTFQRLKDIEVLIGQLATALFPEKIEELIQDVRSYEDRMKSSLFYQRFTASVII